jgi:hypothetical protein
MILSARRQLTSVKCRLGAIVALVGDVESGRYWMHRLPKLSPYDVEDLGNLCCISSYFAGLEGEMAS